MHKEVPCDVLSIRSKRNGQIHSTVLASSLPRDHPDYSAQLASWAWTLPASCATYHALFPFSWTVYEEPVPGIRVIVKQISPFLPHSYSEASLPCAVLAVEVLNLDSASEVEVSMMFSFQNGNGHDLDRSGFPGSTDRVAFTGLKSSSKVRDETTAPILGGKKDEEGEGEPNHCPFAVEEDGDGTGFVVEGVAMSRVVVTRISQDVAPPPHAALDPTGRAVGDVGSFAVAASSSLLDEDDGNSDGRISTCARFVSAIRGINGSSCQTSAPQQTVEDSSAARLWHAFVHTGDINDLAEASDKQDLVSGQAEVACAVCIRKTVSAAGKRMFPFSLAWDSSVVRFGSGKALRRYHSRFFGAS